MRKILIFSFSHIGDAVLSTAVIAPLKEHFPNAEISVVVGPIPTEIFRNDDRIASIIVYDNTGLHAGAKGKFRLIKELKARRFDLSIDLRDTFWSRLIGGKRWGMPLFGRMSHEHKTSHAVDRYLAVLRDHGVQVDNAAPALPVSATEQVWAEDFLRTAGISPQDTVVGIHPGGGWSYKLWEIEHFAALADLISRRFGAKILIFSGAGDEELQDRMVHLMRSSPVTARRINLRKMAALIQQCRLYIGNDTGPMHVAAAVGTQVIAIFGPTNPMRSGPYGKNHIVITGSAECSPCHPGPHPGGCKLDKCLAMQNVSLEKVAKTIERVLE